MGDRGEVLLRAPLNAQAVPANRDAARWSGSQEMLVLIRLEWPGGVEVRPARLVMTSLRAVQVEWQSRPGSKPRRTWLRRQDVRVSMRL